MARLVDSPFRTRASRVALEAQGMRPSTSSSPSVSSSRAAARSGGSPPGTPAASTSGTSLTSHDGRAVAVLGGADVASRIERVAAQRARLPALPHDLGAMAGHDTELRAGHPQADLPGLLRRLLEVVVALGSQLGGDQHDAVPVAVVGQRELADPEVRLHRLVQPQVTGLGRAHLAR